MDAIIWTVEHQEGVCLLQCGRFNHPTREGRGAGVLESKTTPSHTFWFGMGLGKSPDVHLNSIGEILRKIQHTWDEVVAMDNKFTTNDWP